MSDGRDDRERNAGIPTTGKRPGIPANTPRLKQTLISKGERIRIPAPANVSARAEGVGRGGQSREGTGVGVNAQFVFRSAEKTRSLYRIARRTRRNSSPSPTSA